LPGVQHTFVYWAPSLVYALYLVVGCGLTFVYELMWAALTFVYEQAACVSR
jgi:hypothetical protein